MKEAEVSRSISTDARVQSQPVRRPATEGLSRRALVLAFALLVVLIVIGFWADLVYAVIFNYSAGVPAMAPLFLLFLVTAVNSLVLRLGWRPLSRKELLTIYVIVLMGGIVIDHGILPWLLPYTIAQQYYARAIPEYATSYINSVPLWIGPTDFHAVEDYFQGKAHVPWALWWTPLAAWLSFVVALLGATVTPIIILRRQWITHERLSFPIAQVPLELVQADHRDRGRLPVGWLFWIGFLIPLCIGAANQLSRFFPAFPGIPIDGLVLMQAQATGPWAGIGEITLVLTPWMIAIAYLIPKDLSFSCWFFWFVRVAMTCAAIAWGATIEPPEMYYGSGFPAPHHQGGGAILALTVWMLWTARRHLARVFRIAVGRESGADADEPMAYRWALLIFVLSFIYLVYFTVAAGSRPLVGTAMIGLIVVNYVLWARLRAETGLGFLNYPFRVDEMLVAATGSALFTTREVIMLYNLRWAYYPGASQSFEVSTGNALDSFRIADSARIPSRPLFAAMLVGFVLALGLGTYVVMTGMYHFGLQNMRVNNGGWLGPQLSYIGGRIFNMLQNPTGFDLNAAIAVAVGVVVTVLLGAMRLRFWWWPFHPIGYLAAACWGMQLIWMPFMLGWILKSLTIRYGGLQLYRKTLPVAIGLIVGDFVGQGLWTVVGLLTVNRP